MVEPGVDKFSLIWGPIRDIMQPTESKLKFFFLNPRNVFIFFFLGINILNLQSIWANRLNTFDIYYYCFPNMLHHLNLYTFHLDQYRDLYKYSPTFAALFAPFSVLPYYVSYFLWNNMCMLIMPLAIFSLPLDSPKKSIICWFVFIECLTCLQGTQADTIAAALFVLTFSAFERKQVFLAALWISIGTYTKIFPIAGACLFLMYPDKWKFIWSMVVCMVVLFLVPLCFISFDQLVWQYKNWYQVVASDQSSRFGISIIGLVRDNLGVSHAWYFLIQLIVLGVFLSQFLRYKFFSSLEMRLYMLASLLFFIVLVNHDAEDFSYTMTMIGVGIWFVLQPRSKWLNNLMLLFVIVVSVFPIDPTPKPIIQFMVDHALKALPATILWFYVLYQIFTKSNWRNQIPPDELPGVPDYNVRLA
jgi:hypothetical protein